MKIFRNRTVIGVLCILLALIICFGVTPLFSRSASEKTEIVRVTMDIKEGDEITAEMVQTVEVGAYNLPQNLMTDKKEVVGKYATADLAAGDYILSSKLSAVPAAENAYLYNLDGTKQAISVTIKSFATGLSGKLESGDIVTIIVADYQGKGETAIPPELQYVQIGKNMGVFNEMSIVLILFPMYRGNLFDFLQFDNAVFLSAFRCKGCFHICCPIQINIPIKCSIRCRCYQIYKLIDNIVADSATTKINKAVQSGTDTLYIQSFRIAFFLWNFIKCFLKFLDFFIDRTSHCLILVLGNLSISSHSNQVSQSAICLIQFRLYRYRIGLSFVRFFFLIIILNKV